LPNTEVQKGSIIDLYLNVKSKDTIIMPSLADMTKEEVIRILDGLNLNYNLKGTGTVVTQSPMFGEEINLEQKIEVEFKER
jgi:stage V sporulation protein D (sporulation-specific penicillin-binding protein)